jgi:PAS domain S-box-containing protein
MVATGEEKTFIGRVSHVAALSRDRGHSVEPPKTSDGLFDAMPMGLLLVDTSGVICDVNASAVHLLGLHRDTLVGQCAWQLLPGLKTFVCGSSAVRETGDCLQTRCVAGKKSLSLEVSVSTIRRDDVTLHLLSVVDVTVRETLKAELRHSERLRTIGMLAGSMAHEFNNVLTAILGLGSFVQMRMKKADPSFDDIRDLMRVAEGARGLTTQLLSFSRKWTPAQETVQLNEVLRRLERMLCRVAGRELEVRFVLNETTGCVRIDTRGIEQVLLNLAVNARDATEGLNRQPRVTIETSRVWVAGGVLRTGQEAPAPGCYNMIRIEDNGVGMDAATLERIFDPFFTTKEAARGTGLGLYTSLGIINEAGGHMTVDSQQGVGTTFRIYLPVVDEASELSSAVA